jgi:hypothetical protein
MKKAKAVVADDYYGKVVDYDSKTILPKEDVILPSDEFAPLPKIKNPRPYTKEWYEEQRARLNTVLNK